MKKIREATKTENQKLNDQLLEQQLKDIKSVAGKAAYKAQLEQQK